MPGIGFAIHYGFHTKTDAEAALAWHPSYAGDPYKPYDVTEVETEFDETKVLREFHAFRESGKRSKRWGVVLHEPGDVFGVFYAKCAKETGITLGYTSQNGDTIVYLEALS